MQGAGSTKKNGRKDKEKDNIRTKRINDKVRLLRREK